MTRQLIEDIRKFCENIEELNQECILRMSEDEMREAIKYLDRAITDINVMCLDYLEPEDPKTEW